MPRRNDQSTDAWEALHRIERETVDSPARFELSQVSTVVQAMAQRRVPASSVNPVGAQGRSRVRPYARTGGRTRSAHDLALEALVSTSEKGRYSDIGAAEHRAIRDLCFETRSVAEVAAHLRLPLGVVKVLIGDMAEAGLVLIHQTAFAPGDRSSREFMERVLQCLRAL